MWEHCLETKVLLFKLERPEIADCSLDPKELRLDAQTPFEAPKQIKREWIIFIFFMLQQGSSRLRRTGRQCRTSPPRQLPRGYPPAAERPPRPFEGAAHNDAPVRRSLRDGSEELEVCAEELVLVAPGVVECLRCPRRKEPAHRTDVIKGGTAMSGLRRGTPAGRGISAHRRTTYSRASLRRGVRFPTKSSHARTSVSYCANLTSSRYGTLSITTP